MTPRRFSPLRGIAIISTVWLLGIVVLIVGTITKSRIGFVWPMGQDIDWSIILKQGAGALAAQQEFGFDHRNPLSGWVYSLASPLILGHEYGFHFLRLLSCLFLGLSVYLLALRFSRGRALFFPTVLGVIISIWWFWEGPSHVIWLMIFSLALSVLIIWSYCAYVDSGRTAGLYYGYSLALWLLVLGTYSLQCGAIVPVFLIAWFRGPDRGFIRAVKDVSPFVIVAACFAGIWMAAAGPFFASPSIAKTTHMDASIGQAALSAARFVWHPIFGYLVNAVASNWSVLVISMVAVLSAAIVAGVSAVTGTDKEPFVLREGSIWTLVSLICLAAPTLLLEATSPAWGPGTRSTMMISAFVPTVCVCLTVLAFSAVSVRAVRPALITIGTVMTASVVLFNLEQNRHGVEAMAWQKNLALPLRAVQAATSAPVHFVVFNTSGLLQVGQDFGTRFAQDKIGRVQPRWTSESLPNEASMRFVETTEAPANFPGAWRVQIGSKSVKGALYGRHDEVPRDSVVLVAFDGRTARALEGVTPADLRGMQADITD